jgi:diadenosine tetraphosphatase ApaH/serine/threonine PP2A family protein phosphatase
MRVLVVSDIHANIHALNAVLEDAGSFDMLWSLGDVVGYGPDPEACIATIRTYEHLAIPGNHDWGVLGRLDLEDFNNDARAANLWTREQLSEEARHYLEELPETRVAGEITLAHGSPRYPIWEYLFYASTATLNFPYLETSICLVGHTHMPVVFWQPEENSLTQMLALPENEPLTLDQGQYIVNPGSVGQPRDGDPRAAYLLVETDTLTVEHRRVAYPIERTQEHMRAVGLPGRLISRLALGW